MALIHCDFHSDALGMASSMYVILPQQSGTQIGMESVVRQRKAPVLWLLHGYSDDHTIWLRRTSIERYAAHYGIAVVMPAVHRSFYTDMVHGYRYWTYVSEELPQIARSFFPLSEAREDNFVAGLSMGGYGALKLGLRCPDRYAAAASLSGATRVHTFRERLTNDYHLIFGDREVVGSDDDLFVLADRAAASGGPKPALFQTCGTEDFLYEDNVSFRDHCRKIGLPLTYEEWPGEHEWGYWDTHIKRVLEWLPLRSE